MAAASDTGSIDSLTISTCDVAIVGAGPGGLATALALQKQGLHVQVFEQRTEFRPTGVAVFIWPHGLQHLKTIDAATCDRVINAGAPINQIAIDRLDPGSTDPEELLTINVAGWSTRMDLPPQIGITWARLTNALREGLDENTIQLGHTLKDVTEYQGNYSYDAQNESSGVLLTFAPTRDGKPAPPSVRARLCVVGADGRNSKVREAVFDDVDSSNAKINVIPEASSSAPQANVYYALSPNPPPGGNGAACRNELRFSLCDGSGISLLDVGRGNLDLNESGKEIRLSADAENKSRDGQVMFGTTRFSEPSKTFETPVDRLNHLKGLFTKTTPLLRAAIDSTDANEVVQTQLFERDGAKEWSKGRVVLLGDAAHCMYPSLGLGISTAFADAVELSKNIELGRNSETKSTIETSLAMYSRIRAPNAWLLQMLSRIMHSVLASTSEKPKSDNTSNKFDPSRAFFKLWQGALWVFGDR